MSGALRLILSIEKRESRGNLLFILGCRAGSVKPGSGRGSVRIALKINDF
jgi:hypothetical protein